MEFIRILRDIAFRVLLVLLSPVLLLLAVLFLAAESTMPPHEYDFES